MAARRRRVELKIVLDTNAIWNDSESDLLRREISELVNNNRGDTHLVIQWTLPDIVLKERTYQMQRAAAKLLPYLQRLERVIGIPLNITEDMTNARIGENVARQVANHQLVIHPASYRDVDWDRVVGDAVNRRPPFELNPKIEKGFRDAIIAETFAQLVESSPAQSERCRIVLLTNDRLLSTAVLARTSARSNVIILNSPDQLLGLINTLMSTVTEKDVAELQAKAAAHFVQGSKSDEGYFAELRVKAEIKRQFKTLLEVKPPEADRRRSGGWGIASPRFVRKERQRIYWASRITVSSKAYKQIETARFEISKTQQAFGQIVSTSELYPPQTNVPGQTGFTPITFLPSSATSPMFQVSFPAAPTPSATEKLVATGQTICDVNWSVAVSVKGKFSRPQLGSIDFIGTEWEPVP